MKTIITTLAVALAAVSSFGQGSLLVDTNFVVRSTNFWINNARQAVGGLQTQGVQTNYASATTNGYLSSADWQTFNAKLSQSSTNNLTRTNEPNALSLSNPLNRFVASSVLASNLFMGSNTLAYVDTNTLVFYLAGNTTNNVAHKWDTNCNCFSNSTYRSIATFQNPTYFLKTIDAVNQYSAPSWLGPWSVVNGLSNAPISTFGITLPEGAIVHSGVMDATSAKAVTSSFLDRPLTNSVSTPGSVDAGTFSGNGSSITNVNALQLGGNPASYYAPTSSVVTVFSNGLAYDVQSAIAFDYTNGLFGRSMDLTNTPRWALGIGGSEAVTPLVTGANLGSFVVGGIDLWDRNNTNVLYSDLGGGAGTSKGFAYTNDSTASKFVQDGANNVFAQWMSFQWVATNAGTGTIISTNTSLTGLYKNTAGANNLGLYFRPQFKLVAQPEFVQSLATTVTNSSSELNLLALAGGKPSFYGGDTNLYPDRFYVGAKWVLSGSGVMSVASGNTATLTIKVYVGSTNAASVTLAAAALPTNVANVGVSFNIPITVTAISGGNVSAVIGGGFQYQITVSSVPTMAIGDLSNSGTFFTFPSTARTSIGLTATWSANVAGNNLTINQAHLLKLN